ncbi:hypothetical protein [Treponema lecithinolyticum]
MMGIKDDRLIIDYTPDVKRALSILKKFTGGKHRKEFQNRFFLTEDSDGSYVFAATDGAVMAVYRLNTTVYVPENTPNLSLDLSGKEFDEEKKTISFPVRSECPIDMKRYIAGLKKYERNESIALHDISDFLRFCKEPDSASKRLYFSLHGARLCAKLCYRRNFVERVIPYNKDTISTDGMYFTGKNDNKLAFDAMYVIKILSCIQSEQAVFTFSDATHAVCCRDGCCTYFLMPLLTE